VNTEIVRHAYRRTLDNQSGVETDIVASRRAAVENVKNAIIRQRKTNAIVDEWLIAKEEARRWSLRK
jgi:hypothetical protein